ncbi:E3 ubiquitin-protein ligase HERC2 [Galdieria sulphuraria]|nr:E3 ubiquitin-protein ligase HERC2 [Galdieria sulphuraria]
MSWKIKLVAATIAISCSYKVSYAETVVDEVKKKEPWNLFSWFSFQSKDENEAVKATRLLFWGSLNDPSSTTKHLDEEVASTHISKTSVSRKSTLPRIAQVKCPDIQSVLYWKSSLAFLSKKGDVSLFHVDDAFGDSEPHQLESGNVAFRGIALSPIGQKLLAWSQQGELFEAEFSESAVLNKVSRNWIGEHKVDHIHCGKSHCLALTKQGVVLSWGLSDSFGQLGRGQVTSEDNCETPGVVVVPKDIRVQKVCCGDAHSAFLMEDGSVWTCGSNQWLQLGNKEEPWKDGNDYRPTPQRVQGIGQRVATDIACGAHHTLILIKDGTVYSCGFGRWGQLGHHNYAQLSYLSRISWLDGLRNGRIRDIAAGSNHSCLVTTDGKLYSLGANFAGQLGIGTLQPSAIPRLVKGLDHFHVEKVFCSGDWTAVVGFFEDSTNL